MKSMSLIIILSGLFFGIFASAAEQDLSCLLGNGETPAAVLYVESNHLNLISTDNIAVGTAIINENGLSIELKSINATTDKVAVSQSQYSKYPRSNGRYLTSTNTSLQIGNSTYYLSCTATHTTH